MSIKKLTIIVSVAVIALLSVNTILAQDGDGRRGRHRAKSVALQIVTDATGLTRQELLESVEGGSYCSRPSRSKWFQC